MSYIIEQKIKGKIYLYQVESYWDSEKKQARQRRKYIGRKKEDFQQTIANSLSSISVKIYGDVFLLQSIAKDLGLIEILSNVFPDNYNEILALAFYEITQSNPLYLFPYWLDEHYLHGVKKLDSASISNLNIEIGKSKDRQIAFLNKWVEHLQPMEAIYYDITSVSSYATNNDFLEWGHNRDGENLPQINMGVICCSKRALPATYQLYTGSIVDVSTLSNSISFLKAFGLKDFMCIMDRGFHSSSNLIEMNKPENRIKFIQPLPFSVKKVKDLVTKNKRSLGLSYNAFSFNNEILYYVKDKYILDDKNEFDVHLYFNEKSKIDQKEVILSKIIALHSKMEKKVFAGKKQFDEYKNSEIQANFRDYFRWNKIGKKVERNNKAIEKSITRLGSFVIATNKNDLKKEEVLSYYRRRDSIEKMFDMVKNELDGNRLRVHSNTATEGTMFLKFISLILYCHVARVLKENNLFTKFTIKEVFAELRKIKLTSLEGNQPILSEQSKRIKQIFDAFKLNCTIPT